MLFSSFERGLNIASPGTFPVKPKRILNGCSATTGAPAMHRSAVSALVDDRLIDQRVDLLTVVPAQRPWRRREIDHREFFLRIGPPVGAAGAGPGELPDRSHHPDHARRRAR